MKLSCSISLLIIFSATIQIVNGQELVAVYTTKADSVHQLIDNHNTEDEEMVRLLNEYARFSFFSLEFQNGLIATRDARDLSRKLDFKGGEVMYYLTLSTFLGKEQDMGDYYVRKAEWLSGSDNKLTQYFTDLDIPNGYHPNYLIKSIDKLLESYKYFERIDEKEIQASIINPMAYYYMWIAQNMPETQKCIDAAMNLYKELDLAYPTFTVSSWQMFVLIFEGRDQEATKVELELVDLIAKYKDQEEFIQGLIIHAMAKKYSYWGRYALAIDYHLQSLEAFNQMDDQEMLAETYEMMGMDYLNLEMNSKSIENFKNCLSISQSLGDSEMIYSVSNKMVNPLIALKKYDEARKYRNFILSDTNALNKTYLLSLHYDTEGQILKEQQKFSEAIPYFEKAYYGFKQSNFVGTDLPFAPLYISSCYFELSDYQSALAYALQSLDLENALNSKRIIVKSKVSLLLSKIYDKLNNKQKAYDYLKMHQDIREESDRLDGVNRIKDAEVRSVLAKNEKEIKQLEDERTRQDQETKTQRFWIFSISGAFISAIVLSLMLYRNNKSKQKANALLQKQKEELQSTQSQLIQSEKMASLGELTAGIAHEIQNPLNFVNNFSEVNTELIKEIQDERRKTKDERDEELENEIINDIAENEKKINHHGKRADAIVKGMLQHSKSSSGKKEPTDINALCDEYLRLAYHGLRAKDKTFNSKFETDFDTSLEKINVVPQDMGRVVLNLITNAFYACAERSRSAASQQPATNNDQHEPLVVVSTRKLADKVEISVTDNGNGIPDSIKEKIFQPFFTTKPTGQGTGLGLSLSYDIVKAHGGDLTVHSTADVGSIFTIALPC